MAGGLEIPWRERAFVVKSFQMAKVQGEAAAATAPGAKIPATQTLSSGAADPESRRLAWINRGMLAGALLAALLVYHTCLNAGWFYDDQDYVLLDPRVGNLKLFMPGSWSQPPPSLDELGQNLMLPGYDKPVIADRYLWHLSFALERAAFGIDPYLSHAVNIAIHLGCVLMLFLALTRLVKLYLEDAERRGAPAAAEWKLLPGVAALIFAVHPWAAEPVCYVSARNGGMGAFFCLLGLWLFCGTLEVSRGIAARILFFGGALFCALLAYGSKENFIAAPAGYLLAVWPLIFSRYWSVSRGRTLAILGGGITALLGVAWIGIQSSERARGLFAQMSGAGWRYLFEIQGPTLLMTLLDHLLCRRLSIETGFPDWAVAACWLAIFINAALLLLGTIGGRITPLLLGLGWYYVFLLPSNSVLPRPDFLAGRNVYLPTVGVTVLLAGVIVWGLGKARRSGLAGTNVVAAFATSIWLYWGLSAHGWAAAFTEPEQVWSRSAQVAPDHAVIRLNLAIEMLKQKPAASMKPEERKRLEKELMAALDAENSPTMRYHSSRPKEIVRALAWRMLGDLRHGEQRHDEADEFYRKSWEQGHSPSAWLNWLQTAVDGKMSARQSELLEIGFREWPNAWWPQYVKDMTDAMNWNQTTMTPQLQADFEAAERAPDAGETGLRSLQCQAIMRLLQQSLHDKPLAHARLARLQRMGVGEDQLEALEKQLGGEE
jgi:hypothetical protein